MGRTEAGSCSRCLPGRGRRMTGSELPLTPNERIKVAAAILHCRTWGHPLTEGESLKLDSQLRVLALQVRDCNHGTAITVPTMTDPLTQPMTGSELPLPTYRTIVADPPWHVAAGPRSLHDPGEKTRALDIPIKAVDAIMEIIGRLSAIR